MIKLINIQLDLFSAINDFDLYVLKFADYGKDFPKEHNMSPDAFIQMCLQFTYFKFVLEIFIFIQVDNEVWRIFFLRLAFRMYNKLVSTYESASTRRFHCGRVDNIRANTPEALEWARAMVDETGNISAAEKLRLFRQAMQAQTDLMIQVIPIEYFIFHSSPSSSRTSSVMEWIVIVSSFLSSIY